MKKFCVVSHTHWDREWYMPLEIFRLKLIDLIDRCLVTLEKYPDYIFHLDAQTIVLEDYLAIRPSKYNQLKEYITAGRLVVGPWYLQNDFYLTSGEATVRNLLEGHRVANEFGGCSKVGYAPDQFGNISQLPQILENFGIDNFIFGRGINEYRENEQGVIERIAKPSEFIWCGADGTEVLAIFMPFWYNNAQRFSAETEKAKLMVDVMDNKFEGVAVTPYILLMNGVDHLEAQDDLLPILAEVNGRLVDGKSIMQYRMDKYIEQVKAYINEHHITLNTYKGELRKGQDGELLQGTLSSRSYLKSENVKAQNRLECMLEPLYSVLELSGAKGVYSVDHFRYMWKELLKNHPHDSICGCSRDEVHMHMEDNYKRLAEMAEEILRRGLLTATEHMELKNIKNENYVLIAVNTVEKRRNGVIEATFDFPTCEAVMGFDIKDNDGEMVPYDIVLKEKAIKDVFSPVNLPGSIEVDRYQIVLYVKDIEGLAIKGYIVSKSDAIKEPMKICSFVEMDEPIILENEFLKVVVLEKGTVNIYNKQTKEELYDVIDFEETADRGDAYLYNKTEDAPIFASAFKADVVVLENNEYIKKCKITRKMIVPVDYDFVNLKRTDETVACDISVSLTLEKGSKMLEVSYEIDNRAKCHRIRMLVNTGVNSEYSVADIPFDIVKHSEDDHHFSSMSKVLPNSSFALLENDAGGVAVFSEGTHEYEHLRDTLAFTIVRSTGVIARLGDLSSCGGAQWDVPENQCIRKLTGRLAIMPYESNYISAQIPLFAKQFRNPLMSFFAPCDTKKFAGGRTAVQDTKLAEFFYLEDPYADTKITDNMALLEIIGNGVVVSALKKAEDGTGIIARLVNLSENTVDTQIGVKGKIYLTDMSEGKEEYLGEDMIEYKLNAKKILTIKIVL